MMCVYACNSWFNYCMLVPNGHFVLSTSCCVVPLRNLVFALLCPLNGKVTLTNTRDWTLKQKVWFDLHCRLHFLWVDSNIKVAVLTYKEHHIVQYIPSSELGLPQPLSRKRVCPPPEPKGGGAHSPAAKGVGESRFRWLEKKLSTLPTVCIK